MKLYFHNTPNPFKAALMLEELGLDYDVVPVDTRKGEQHDPDFLRVNPNAKLPALEDDDGTVVFDSNAIVLYLAQTRGKLLPSDGAGMGEALSWLFWIATGLSPFSGQFVHFVRVHTDSAYATNRYRKELLRHYGVLDDRLAGRDWIAGDGYGVCDVAAWGWVRMAPMLLANDGGLERFGNVADWFARVDGRPAAERARALGDRFDFKTEMDEQAMRAMFPGNYD